VRYRVLDANGDYVFGQGPSEFLVNSPAAVGQAVKTRLALDAGEWFLDQTEGLTLNDILGYGTQPIYDQVIQERILGTQGMLSIAEYTSVRDATRKLTVDATLNTIYGVTQITATI
jgi:hypothetical protein